MTPRKELYISIKNCLSPIKGIEMVAYDRDQFGNGKENYPTSYTACLIRINRIDWETMTNNNQIGNTTVTIKFYCKDGWSQQFSGSTDLDNGLVEIELLDSIVEKLQFLTGDCFAPLEQISDEPDEISPDETTSYSLTFKTILTRKTTAFTTVKLKKKTT